MEIDQLLKINCQNLYLLVMIIGNIVSVNLYYIYLFEKYKLK